MDFKVGDRVIYKEEGDKGIIERFEAHRIWVSWDEANGSEAWVTEDMIETIPVETADQFSETVLSFARSEPVVSEEDITHIRDLGEQLGISSFGENVRRITTQIAELLIEKNAAYGDSALNPIRVFSKADRIEQLNVRIDDKISRIQRGSEYGDEDTEMDLIGYLVLRKIARESE